MLRVPAPSVPLAGRRRRVARADAPRTIIPVDNDAPFALRVDAARERLRRAIPPVADED
jgi:hypothetical protein